MPGDSEVSWLKRLFRRSTNKVVIGQQDASAANPAKFNPTTQASSATAPSPTASPKQSQSSYEEDSGGR